MPQERRLAPGSGKGPTVLPQLPSGLFELPLQHRGQTGLLQGLAEPEAGHDDTDRARDGGGIDTDALGGDRDLDERGGIGELAADGDHVIRIYSPAGPLAYTFRIELR